ncbi:MAG: dihydropteroate synthase [Pseudomonadota bacterium]
MNKCFLPRTWSLAKGRSIELGRMSVIMGILNVTPDSFSDGGEFDRLEEALAQALKMIGEGASIIDIGGESTRPGASPVTAQEEQDRVLPVIERLAKETDIILSVDTYRASTAALALKAGAHIINDVWGFQKDPDIARVAAENGAGVCAMHTGRERTRDPDVVKDQMGFLGKSVEALKEAGVEHDSIVLDPGFGFAKDPHENAELLARFEELHDLGYPLLTGTSRKRFIGHYTGRDAANRDIGTAATSVVARMKGSAIFRVHDVGVNADALAIADAVISNGRVG